jgi:hypothetical protein
MLKFSPQTNRNLVPVTVERTIREEGLLHKVPGKKKTFLYRHYRYISMPLLMTLIIPSFLIFGVTIP